MTNLPLLSDLQTLGIAPQYFGLGFIQLKLDAVRRLHFWTPDWPSIPGSDTELHDHRYDFTSQVLRGVVCNEVFTTTPISSAPGSETHELIHVTCKPGAPDHPEIMGYVTPVSIAQFQTHPGGQYTLSSNTFHRAHSIGQTVTLLRRSETIKPLARVLRPIGAPSVCPFSIQMTEDQCWKRISECLKV